MRPQAFAPSIFRKSNFQIAQQTNPRPPATPFTSCIHAETPILMFLFVERHLSNISRACLGESMGTSYHHLPFDVQCKAFFLTTLQQYGPQAHAPMKSLMQAWGAHQPGSPAYSETLQRCSVGAAQTCRATSTAPLQQTPPVAEGLHSSE